MYIKNNWFFLSFQSEGGLYENGIKLFPEDGSLENGAVDEMADLKRQVIFLQQQLEEREKTVQNLQLEINKTTDVGKSNGTSESREQCNAATQTDRVMCNLVSFSIVSLPKKKKKFCLRDVD